MKPLHNYQIYTLAWRITGGFSGLVRGVDFALALAIWVACIPIWSEPKWWDQAISVLPNLLGFTLGGFAIFLGFGNDDFRDVIAEQDEMRSPYLSVSAAFLVFVLAQILALFYAIAAMALYQPPPQWLAPLGGMLAFMTPVAWGIGYLAFIVSIMYALRAATRIFRISRWYNEFLVRARDEDEKPQ